MTTTHDIYVRESSVQPVQRSLKIPKHSQAILAIDSAFFYERGFGNGVQRYSLAQLYAEVDPYVQIRQRAFLERSLAARQILPYKVLTQGGKIIAYRRLKAGGEARLYGQTSIGFGGHVDFEDVITYRGDNPESDDPQLSTIDLETTIRHSSARELGQEVHFITASGGQVPFEPELSQIVPADMFIHYNLKSKLGAQWEIGKDVHSVHVAFVYNVEVPQDFTLVSGEPDKIEMLPAMEPSELLYGEYSSSLEEWTRLLLTEMVEGEGTSSYDSAMQEWARGRE